MSAAPASPVSAPPAGSAPLTTHPALEQPRPVSAPPARPVSGVPARPVSGPPARPVSGMPARPVSG
ncbi:hypothetical protein QLR68_36010, partial [Micromonospora sp. DH15]|nr:hypothetical protein [Micromonospora sp. DH15]